MKKILMKRAWKIRKEAASRIGCKVSEVSFSDCLKAVWSEAKGGIMEELDKLSDIYGRVIKEDDHIIKNEKEMFGYYSDFPLTTKQAAINLIAAREHYNESMDRMSEDYVRQAPCDNAGHMSISSIG